MADEQVRGSEPAAAVRDQAHGIGLLRLTEEHLQQFERAAAGMQRHLQRLPRDLPAEQEPAPAFRPVDSAG